MAPVFTPFCDIFAVVSIGIYANAGLLDYSIGIPLLFGALLGGWLGARTAIRKGNTWLTWVFAVVVVASAIKLLFF